MYVVPTMCQVLFQVLGIEQWIKTNSVPKKLAFLLSWLFQGVMALFTRTIILGYFAGRLVCFSSFWFIIRTKIKDIKVGKITKLLMDESPKWQLSTHGPSCFVYASPSFFSPRLFWSKSRIPYFKCKWIFQYVSKW